MNEPSTTEQVDGREMDTPRHIATEHIAKKKIADCYWLEDADIKVSVRVVGGFDLEFADNQFVRLDEDSAWELAMFLISVMTPLRASVIQEMATNKLCRLAQHNRKEAP